MKHLKTKLVSAIAMLAVAAIMMTSATYAWFTISTNPEIKNVSANVTANGNLEIALDNGTHSTPADSAVGDYGKNETWGNLVDLDYFFDTAELVLKPVQAAYANGALTFQYPTYTNDGRIKELKDLTAAGAESGTTANSYQDVDGVKVWAASTLSDNKFTPGEAATSSADIYAFEIDYWLRTNSSASYLTLQKTETARADGMATGSGSILTVDDVTIIIVVSSATKGTTLFKAERNTGDNTLSLKEQDYANNAFTDTASGKTSYEMPVNEAVEVRMYAFMDGKSIKNSDAKLALTDFIMNVQFTVGALDSMDVTPVS